MPRRRGGTCIRRGATRAALDAHFAAHPESRAELLAARSIVQAATPENVRQVVATLDKHPVLDVLHPGAARARHGRRRLHGRPILRRVYDRNIVRV